MWKRDRCIDDWPINESASKKPTNWCGWPEQKLLAIVLIHDVDTKDGINRCRRIMDLEERMGFRSAFYFVPERYEVPEKLRTEILARGFEVGVHGLKHDGKLFSSRKTFCRRVPRINRYIEAWNASGFSTPSMLRNLEWIKEIYAKYAIASFDTDPFEPQPDGSFTIFPEPVYDDYPRVNYYNLPYTLPQDFTVFVLMKERNIDIWQEKLDWIAKNGGLALLNTHPDYMEFTTKPPRSYGLYPYELYKEFLEYAEHRYGGKYLNVVPAELVNMLYKSFTSL